MIEWLGPIVHEYYGCDRDGRRRRSAPPRSGSPTRARSGAALPDATRSGSSTTTAARLPAGESGEVYVRLHAWPDFTYRGDDAKRARDRARRPDHLGDIGYLDADGYLYLNDRRSDMIISGGVNIYPAEIEACLHRRCAACATARCSASPTRSWARRSAPTSTPTRRRGLTAEAVREHVGNHLARYKVPRVVEFSDALPREDSGKVFKRLLREPYWT